jgi:hypothetical protein
LTRTRFGLAQPDNNAVATAMAKMIEVRKFMVVDS